MVSAAGRDYRVKAGFSTTSGVSVGALGNRGPARYISRPMTDAEMLRQIVTALAEGRADVAFSGRLESHMDFPGNSETDKTQFVIVGLLLIGLAYWFGKWWLVAAAVGLVVAVYLGFWRGVVRRRMRRRFIAKAMADPIVWRKSWSFPGIALSAAGEDCRSPAGDWRVFATKLKEQISASPAIEDAGTTEAQRHGENE